MPAILKPYSLLNPGPLQVPNGPLQVDWTHRLANGLIGAWLPGVMGGVDISGQAPTLTLDTGAGIVPGQEGVGLNSTVANSGMFSTVAPPAFKNWTALTLYWRGYLIGNSNNFAEFISIDYSNPNGSPFFLASIDGSSTGNIAGGMRVGWNNGGTGNFANIGLTVVAGMADFALTLIVGLSNPVTFYQYGGSNSGDPNGGTAAVGNFGTGAPTSTATSYLSIGGPPSATSPNNNAIMFAAYYWNRALTAEEVLFLHYAPYDFFIPDEYELPVAQFIPPPPLTLMPQIVT